MSSFSIGNYLCWDLRTSRGKTVKAGKDAPEYVVPKSVTYGVFREKDGVLVEWALSAGDAQRIATSHDFVDTFLRSIGAKDSPCPDGDEGGESTHSNGGERHE
jgi:hypothetical protein